MFNVDVAVKNEDDWYAVYDIMSKQGFSTRYNFGPPHPSNYPHSEHYIFKSSGYGYLKALEDVKVLGIADSLPLGEFDIRA